RPPARRRRPARPHRGRGPDPGDGPVHVDRLRQGDGGAVPRRARGAGPAGRLMLTVDYDRLGVQAGDVLLDVGAGGGRHAFEAARRGARVVPVDISAADLKDAAAVLAAMVADGDIAPETVAGCVNGDATQLPFADESFDKVIAAEVMEHVPDDVGALRELTRVLRPGGVLAVTVPRWLPERVCW